MGLWDGLDKAQVFDRGVFLDPGMYDLQIKQCIDKQTRKAGQAYIVEFTVLRSSNPKYPPGTTVTWFQSMKDRDVAFGAVKEFIAAVYGFNLRDKAQLAEFDAKINPSLPGIADASTTSGYLNGKPVFVETQMVKTQRGSDFTRHNWAKYDPTRVIEPMKATPQASPTAGVPALPAGLPGLPR